jgi:hypothetical protein
MCNYVKVFVITSPRSVKRSVTCAGVPSPSVRWYRDEVLIDDSYQECGNIKNDLYLMATIYTLIKGAQE